MRATTVLQLSNIINITVKLFTLSSGQLTHHKQILTEGVSLSLGVSSLLISSKTHLRAWKMFDDSGP